MMPFSIACDTVVRVQKSSLALLWMPESQSTFRFSLRDVKRLRRDATEEMRLIPCTVPYNRMERKGEQCRSLYAHRLMFGDSGGAGDCAEDWIPHDDYMLPDHKLKRSTSPDLDDYDLASMTWEERAAEYEDSIQHAHKRKRGKFRR